MHFSHPLRGGRHKNHKQRGNANWNAAGCSASAGFAVAGVGSPAGKEQELHDSTTTVGICWRQARPGPRGSAMKSYCSITAATPTSGPEPLLSTRTTLPWQRTRILSVSVTSGGSVIVNSMRDPSASLDWTLKKTPCALTFWVSAGISSASPSVYRIETGKRKEKRRFARCSTFVADCVMGPLSFPKAWL